MMSSGSTSWQTSIRIPNFNMPGLVFALEKFVADESSYFCRIKGCGDAGRPPPNIFERSKPKSNKLYHFVGDLSESPNPFCWKIFVFCDLPFDFLKMVNL